MFFRQLPIFLLPLLLLTGICTLNVHAQSFSYLGIEQGLSNSTVTTIYKDTHGFMWFGTFDGLNRFDGYNFTRFRNRADDTTSIPDNYVTGLEEDSSGNLWVATRKGIGVLSGRLLNMSHVRYKGDNLEAESRVIEKPVNTLKRDSKANIYAGSNDLGLLIAKGGSGIASQIPLVMNSKRLFHYSVPALCIGRNNNVWFIVDGIGLFLLEAKSRKISLVSTLIKSGNAMEVGADGMIWIGTNNGLFSCAPNTNDARSARITQMGFSTSRILDLCFETNDKLWMATDGDGLILIDTRLNKLIKVFKQEPDKSLSSNALYAVFVDEASRKWIGTMRGGINILDSKKNRFETFSHEPYKANSIIHNTVMSFCEDGEQVWIGTDGGGISIWNRKQNTFKHHIFKEKDKSHSGANQIPSIIRDAGQRIWIATYGSGVKRYDKRSGSFEDIPFIQKDKGAKYVWRLYLDADGQIWAGCIKGKWAGNLKKGLYKYDPQLNSFVETIWPVNSEILSIADDRKGNLWIGTLSSLLRINKKNGRIKQFNLESNVRAIHISETGKIWIGTSGKGLWIYDPWKDQFKNYVEEAGLPNNIVVNIEEDKNGYIWLGTSNGLSRFNSIGAKFENFFAADGLQSNQFYYNASTRLKNGLLLFGGIKGFNSFNPDSIVVYKGFPQLKVTGLKVMNDPVSIESDFVKEAANLYDIRHIVLPYDKSMFSLDFVALEYALPERIQYAYFLNGWDKEWNYIKGTHTISYSRVNPGDYILEIRSTNASGIWNPVAKKIAITVLPPWYLTWWAYSLYLILAGSAVYGYVYYQKEQARLHYEVKLAKQDTLKEAELNEKKISFFTNIAHEFRTPLTLIVNPIKDLLNHNGRNINTVDISSVYRNTRRLLSLVDQLLLFRNAEHEVSDLNPEVIDLVEVCNEVFLCFNNQVKLRAIDYQFVCEAEKVEVYADREKIEIVLFNLLSNAIKYTPEKGKVILELRDIGGAAEMLVRDNGPGIPEEVGNKLFEKFHRLDQGKNTSKKTGFGIGLFVSKKITERQQGELSYVSNAHEGTIFKYMLPKKTAELNESSPAVKARAGTPLLSELIVEPHEPQSPAGDTRSAILNQVYEDVVDKKPVILVIDDDDELRNYIRQFLKEDYTVYEAASAEQGLEWLKQSEPDIIVCDVVMQGMSGVEFCAMLKNSKEFGYIPVILLTGTSSPEVKLKGIECGADDYITKPFEKELLMARIKGLLKGRDSLKRYFFNEVTLQNNNEKISEEYSLFLAQCVETINKHLEDEEFNVKVFVKEMGMSHSNVFRKVKSVSGVSISEFIRYIRLKKAAELMIGTNIQVKEVAFRVGMQDLRYFREQFSKLFGLNPSEYIKKYRSTFYAGTVTVK